MAIEIVGEIVAPLSQTMPTPLLPSARDVHYRFPFVPRQVRLDVAFVCVAACTFCHAWGDFKSPTRTKALMEVSFAEQILQDIAGWPAPLSEIVPTNFSEWTNHPKWYEMGKMIQQYLPNTPIVLPTTGVGFIKEGALEKLASIPNLRWLNFSLNAYFVETWSKILRLPGALMAKVVLMPVRFREMRPDVTINISMVYDHQRITEKEKELFRDYWRSKGFQVSISDATYVKNPQRAPKEPVTVPCRSVFDGLIITPDGHAGTNCCFDSDVDLKVGHFPEQTLLEIWRGEKLRELGRLHNEGKRGEIDICKSCTFA